MSQNITSTWLEARQAPCILPFSKQLATSSGWMNGPGGLAGDGFVLPCAGVLRGLQVFDGYTVRGDDGEVAFNQGDRIAVYATYDGGSGTFTVAVVFNATPTQVAVSSVSSNANVFVTVDLLLLEDA